jgi:hypothetical protein
VTLLVATQTGWRPGLGDNDLVGWMITLAYFLAALLCTAAFRDEARSYRVVGRLQRPAFWLVLTALLVLLGFNKQLDLQTLVMSTGDELVTSARLDAHRRLLKLVSLLTLALTGAAIALAMLLYIGRHWRLYLLAFVGLMYLGVFIVLRAADSLPVLNEINRRYYESIHLLLELCGVLMIGASAARAVYRETRRFKFGARRRGQIGSSWSSRSWRAARPRLASEPAK